MLPLMRREQFENGQRRPNAANYLFFFVLFMTKYFV